MDCSYTSANAVVTTQTQAFSEENERLLNPPKERWHIYKVTLREGDSNSKPCDGIRCRISAILSPQPPLKY